MDPPGAGALGGAQARETAVRLPAVARVKSKEPAQRQVTAEQLVREANTSQPEAGAKPSKQKLVDREELAEHQLRKRKFFEDNVRRNGAGLRSKNLWLRYAEMEMRGKFVN